MERADIIMKQYKLLSYICNQLIHFQSDFENEFYIKNENDKEEYEAVKDLFRTLQNDAFAAAELLFEMIKDEDDLREEVR
jgi:hypothetical protein